MRLLVSGSRDWPSTVLIEHGLNTALDQFAQKATVPIHPVVLVHGAAKGADEMCATFAKRWGWDVEPHPADWRGMGAKAGPMRNLQMIELGADLCVVFLFNRSPGTTHLRDQAIGANIPTYVLSLERHNFR